MTRTLPPPQPACQVCDGERVAVTARADSPIGLHRQGWFGKVAEARALACLTCGLITLHVADLASLRAEVAEHRDTFTW